ncbi:hypothetical protein [Paraburkholderia sp. J7]|uniref:hypothetical protein n=1 Tax=Paraburkholderia sp. J7 TaxID=2805438 RepID=UPI002AB729A8|nr:hypothetical protein [Paraburkholderia sp. J7]
MNGYFATLVSRARGRATPAEVRPRLPSLFEAWPDALVPGAHDAANEFESQQVTDVAGRDAAPLSSASFESFAHAPHGDRHAQDAANPFAATASVAQSDAIPDAAGALPALRAAIARAATPVAPAREVAEHRARHAGDYDEHAAMRAPLHSARPHGATAGETRGSNSRAAAPSLSAPPSMLRRFTRNEPAPAALRPRLPDPAALRTPPTSPTLFARASQGVIERRRAASTETTVVVSIGRVEVRAMSDARDARPRAQDGGPHVMTLDEYLRHHAQH